MDGHLEIAGKVFHSRLILGTGKYRTMEEMVESIEASGTEMVTVAIRRLDLDDPTRKRSSTTSTGPNTKSFPTPRGARPSKKPCSPRAWGDP